MATKEEKQQLIDTLKFTPRTYKISMWGYGGEKVMGTWIPNAGTTAWNTKLISDIAWNYDACEEMDLDEDMLPFTPGMVRMRRHDTRQRCEPQRRTHTDRR
jgi:hypothetical protein